MLWNSSSWSDKSVVCHVWRAFINSQWASTVHQWFTMKTTETQKMSGKRKHYFRMHQPIHLQQSVCQPKQVPRLYRANLNVVSHALLSSISIVVHLVLLLLYSVSYKLFCPTYLHSLTIWLWRGTSIFVLIPHHLTLDGYLVFWTLSTSTNTLTFLSTFAVILSTLWFALRDTTSSLFRPLIWFRTTFLLLPTCKFHPIIVGSSHKPSSTESYNQSTWKPSRLISKILIWLDIRKQMQLKLALQYDSVLHTLIIIRAPLVTKKISIKPPNPWMTPVILASKRYRRYLERIWRSNPTALNRSKLTRQTYLCNRQMSKAKSAHYYKIIDENSADYGWLWKAFRKILHRSPKMHLSYDASIAALENTFSSFFINKIVVFRSSFPSDSHSRVLNPPDTRKVIQNLSCVTTDEVRYLFLLAPYKSSELDPIPTSLVKDCIDILLTPITSIINLSLTEGSFPSHFKPAHVSPFWKDNPSMRIAWRITGQCLILASFPRFLRK